MIIHFRTQSQPPGDPSLRVVVWPSVPLPWEIVEIGPLEYRVVRRRWQADPSDGRVIVVVEQVTPYLQRLRPLRSPGRAVPPAGRGLVGRGARCTPL
jgi:hypothetical protein